MTLTTMPATSPSLAFDFFAPAPEYFAVTIAGFVPHVSLRQSCFIHSSSVHCALEDVKNLANVSSSSSFASTAQPHAQSKYVAKFSPSSDPLVAVGHAAANFSAQVDGVHSSAPPERNVLRKNST